jgi:hypothetical protein
MYAYSTIISYQHGKFIVTLNVRMIRITMLINKNKKENIAMHVISAQKCCGGLFNLPRSVQVGHLKPWCHRHSPLHELPFLPAGIYWFHTRSAKHWQLMCFLATSQYLLGYVTVCVAWQRFDVSWPPKLDGVRFLQNSDSQADKQFYNAALIILLAVQSPKYASSWWFLVGSSPLCVI